ncbi:hypothetical protein ABL78_4870 [Leptomonas seymouri]|uniref:Uncharacterized protein n=1 Tax=Leptomonas seymouri TaxID=5684 RepID=A0A0N1IJV6_LEPSE|nr:hypothetical protein ABL78_4870 [Leptomonas seymouri]|eukprot:KPI86068.1 hypothetical protein ABL78_4870 [Leptomonas seymouri]
MDTRGAHRSQRETRIIQNLPLRRRCLFLMNPNFLCECFDPRDSAARARAASTADLLRPPMQMLEKTLPREESLMWATQGMLDSLTRASSEHAGRNSDDASSRAWTRWAEGVETLLSFLEEPLDTSAGPSPAHCGSRSAASSKGGPGTVKVAASNASAFTASTPRATDTEATVLLLLCALVKHLYECGAAFYAAAKEQDRRAAVESRKRQRGREKSAEAAVVHTPKRVDGAADTAMRVTWSIAALVPSALPELYGIQ